MISKVFIVLYLYSVPAPGVERIDDARTVLSSRELKLVQWLLLWA